jgi:hypothetical protein
MAKKKIAPSLYDENGHWVQEKGRIKGSIRRSFRLSPQMKEVLLEARVELSPAIKKDGTPGKRPRVRYRCAMCNKLWSQKNVNVDHCQPVVPLWKKEADMTYDEIVRGVFCKKDNLQVLCSIAMKQNGGMPSCHKLKTDQENWIRRRLVELNYSGDGLSTSELLSLKQEYDLLPYRRRKKTECKKKTTK